MELRIGIAGAGAMGRAHALAYARLGVPVTAVADTDSRRAELLAADCSARPVSSLQHLLDAGVNAISVCLPHHLHLPAVLLCAPRQIPLLLEKPHCTSASEASQIHHACRRFRQTPMVGFTHRFLRSSGELLRRIRAGDLGRIELVTDSLLARALGPAAPAWYADPAAAGGGITMIGTIHSIDRFRLLLQSELIAVQAVCRSHSAHSVEHLAVILLEFASGACGSLTAYRSPAPGHQRRHHYQIFGSLGIASASVDEFSQQQLSLLSGGIPSTFDCSGDDPFTLEIGEFLASIQQSRPPSPGLHDADRALAAVLAIYESARTGKKVEMEFFMQQHFPWLLEQYL